MLGRISSNLYLFEFREKSTDLRYQADNVFNGMKDFLTKSTFPREDINLIESTFSYLGGVLSARVKIRRQVHQIPSLLLYFMASIFNVHE